MWALSNARSAGREPRGTRQQLMTTGHLVMRSGLRHTIDLLNRLGLPVYHHRKPTAPARMLRRPLVAGGNISARHNFEGTTYWLHSVASGDDL